MTKFTGVWLFIFSLLVLVFGMPLVWVLIQTGGI